MDTRNNKVTLQTPVKRGDNELVEIEIFKPNSGALRGASLRGLLDFHAEDIITVLPRVTAPALTPIEAQQLDPADLLEMGALIADFLLSTRTKEQAREALGFQTA